MFTVFFCQKKKVTLTFFQPHPKVFKISNIHTLKQGNGELGGVEVLHIFSNVRVENPCCKTFKHGQVTLNCCSKHVQLEKKQRSEVNKAIIMINYNNKFHWVLFKT